MITSNVFRRVFYIKVGSSTGTAFTIDVEGRQYLVTACHVCPDLQDGGAIELYRNGQWNSVNVVLIGKGDAGKVEEDVAVLALPVQVSPSFAMPVGSKGLVWGQDVYFLGFPYGLHTQTDVNAGFPIPIVKRALMSGTVGGAAGEVFLLDGHNNPGFSGGPAVFRSMGGTGSDLRVLGLVSAYRTEHVAVTLNGQPTGLTSPANTGIVLCPSIKRVQDIIDANPKGLTIVQ